MKLQLLAIFFISIIGSSCLDDTVQSDFSCEEEGQYYGDFPLMAKTDSLLPYVPGKSLVFVDSLGNEATFVETQPLNELTGERVIRTVCGGSWMEIHEFDSYTYHQKNARYYSGDINARFYLFASKNYLEATDTSFVTYDDFSISIDWSYMSFGYMEDGGDISDFSPSLAEDWITETIGDTTLLGRSFTDVFKSKRQENPIYYSKVTGIAAFRSRENVFWVFDRAE
jgi:hypothetical protein